MKDLGDLQGLVPDDSLNVLDPDGIFLALGSGLNRGFFEILIDGRLVLAGRTSDELHDFDRGLGPVVVKQLHDVPLQFSVKVRIHHWTTIEQEFEFDRSAGSYLVVDKEVAGRTPFVGLYKELVYE